MAQEQQEQEKTKIVRADVLQSILLDEVAGRLADLHKLIAQTIPAGIVPTFTVNLSGQNLQKIKPVTPWFNFSLYNDADSGGTVYVRVNRRNADEHPVEPDDTYNVDMGAAKIEAIYLRTTSGETATVQIAAVR